MVVVMNLVQKETDVKTEKTVKTDEDDVTVTNVMLGENAESAKTVSVNVSDKNEKKSSWRWPDASVNVKQPENG